MFPKISLIFDNKKIDHIDHIDHIDRNENINIKDLIKLLEIKKNNDFQKHDNFQKHDDFQNNLFNINDYYFTINGNLVSSYENINNIIYNTDKLINIECHRKLKGGGGIIDIIMKVVEIVFFPILLPIKYIGEVFNFLIKLIMWLLKFLLWLIRFILWAVTDLLNPLNFLNDFFQTLMLIVVSICRLPFDIIGALFKIAINSIGGWMQGFWGWDMSGLTKNDKNSKYFKSFDRTKGQKTYITNANTVPFSIILGTILCPPMGVFMDMGTSGWLNIIICCLLTLLFYIPGLCYALLIIYS